MKPVLVCYGFAVVLVSLFSSTTTACELCQGSLAECKANIRSLASAIEVYTTDHDGKYPRNLEALSPTYLSEIPNCPNATYQTYRMHSEGLFLTIECTGTHHADVGLPANFPDYSQGGLTERPEVGSAEYLGSSQDYPCPGLKHSVLSMPEASSRDREFGR